MEGSRMVEWARTAAVVRKRRKAVNLRCYSSEVVFTTD